MVDTPSAPTEDGGDAELVYRRKGDESAAEGVVTAVSELTGTYPGAMDPLFDVVDPGALNTLCAHEQRTEQSTPRRVNFQFHGCAVTVYDDGRVAVSRLR